MEGDSGKRDIQVLDLWIIMPVIIRIRPAMVDILISSPTITAMKKREIKGARYTMLLTCAVVRESFKAFSQKTKVNPISNNPMYAAPIIPTGSKKPSLKKRRYAIRM
jgi:hypothetical protein